jgi:uncharacterized protein YbbC (DUF1343 family)
MRMHKILLPCLIIFSLPSVRVWGQFASDSRIIPGADQMELYLPLLIGQRVGLFANQTSTIGRTHLLDSLIKKGITVAKIFAPEHGFRGTADAGENINNLIDQKTSVPIVSLYGSKQQPSKEDLSDIDVLIFDIQDVGVRFYTYISSLQKFLEAALQNNKPVVILDRPNPNGYYVDGPVLEPKFKSFVGMQPVPVVYGMTLGEYAKMIIGQMWLNDPLSDSLLRKEDVSQIMTDIKSIDVKRKGYSTEYLGKFKLIVIPCKNYSHKDKYVLPIKPSPNLPNMQAVYLYPSLCFFEGTTISVGRGTDRPFQQFGSPELPKNLYHFSPQSTEGARNPPYLNQICYGYDLSSINIDQEVGTQIQLKWLLDAYNLEPNRSTFFLTTNYFNKLAGNNQLMQQIIAGETEEKIRESWKPDLARFLVIRKKYLIYPDFY